MSDDLEVQDRVGAVGQNLSSIRFDAVRDYALHTDEVTVPVGGGIRSRIPETGAAAGWSVNQRDATGIVVADEGDLTDDVEVCVGRPGGGAEIANAGNRRLLPVQIHGIEREEHDGQDFH